MFGLFPRLQPNPLHVRLARIHEKLLGHSGGTGKRQRINVTVQGQGLAHRVSMAWQHIEHTDRQPCFQGKLCDTNSRQRRTL